MGGNTTKLGSPNNGRMAMAPSKSAMTSAPSVDEEPTTPGSMRGISTAKTVVKVEEEYHVRIDTEKGRLGLELHPDVDGLWVERVPFGLIFDWNRKHPTRAIKPGNLIVEVNDERDPQEMMAEVKQALVLHFVVQKVKRGRPRVQQRLSGVSNNFSGGRRPSGMSSLSLCSSQLSSLGAPAFLAARPRQPPHALSRLTPDAVRRILELAGASPDQLLFFDDFVNLVMATALIGSTSRRLMVSASLQTLEFSVEGYAEGLLSLMKSFAMRASIPTRMLDELEVALSEIQAPLGAAWCRFKHMGRNAMKSPEVDCGMALLGKVEWMIADVLMPGLSVQDNIMAYASKELAAPCSYTSSILPNEPERSLVYLATKEWLPQKSLQNCLLCLRSAGFLKPPGTALKMLSSFDPLSYGVQVFMGPAGVTRGVLHVGEVARVNTEDLADSLHIEVAPAMVEVNKILGVSADLLDFIDLEVSKRGWDLICGYGSAWSHTFHE